MLLEQKSQTFFKPDDIILAGSDILKKKEDHQKISNPMTFLLFKMFAHILNVASSSFNSNPFKGILLSKVR